MKNLSIYHIHQHTRLISITARLLSIIAIMLSIWAGIRVMSTASVQSDAPQSDSFSLQRAQGDLEIITAEPRVMGTTGLDNARSHLAAGFEKLGLETDITDFSIMRQSAIANGAIIAKSHDIVARIPGTDSSGAILLSGHLDSVHTTVGASDCAGCAVSVLETARALLEGPRLQNDVIFIIEDGEETCRAGSLSFVEQHPWAQDVRVAINLETMGSSGASMLYVTGAENGWLMPQALQAMPNPVAYSFVNDLVWVSGTGGSDLDQFLQAAETGLGLVYTGNVPHYHSATDNLDNLNSDSLQQQGENMLALVRHFGNVDLSGDLTRPDMVYFTLPGHITIHYSGNMALVLAILLNLACMATLVYAIRHRLISGWGIISSAGVLLLILIPVTILCGGLWYVLRLLDARLQVFMVGISYDQPSYSLAFMLLSGGLASLLYSLLLRWRKSEELTAGAIICWSVGALLSAIFLPGSSYVFTFPALFGLFSLVIMINKKRLPDYRYILVQTIFACAGLVILSPALYMLSIFSGRAELIMNLPLIACLPAPFVILLGGLLSPQWEMLAGRRNTIPLLLCIAAAILLFIISIHANFDETRPKPNMMSYVLDNKTGEASWITVADRVGESRSSLLDEWTTQFLQQGSEEIYFNPWGADGGAPANPAYRADAPSIPLPAVQVDLLADEIIEGGLRYIRLQITSQRTASHLFMKVNTGGNILSASVMGQALDELACASQPSQGFYIGTYGINQESFELEVSLTENSDLLLEMEEYVYNLDELEMLDLPSRAAWMIPSPTFVTDTVIVRSPYELP